MSFSAKDLDDTYSRYKGQAIERSNTFKRNVREGMRKHIEKAREAYEEIYGEVEKPESRNFFNGKFLGRNSVAN